MKNLAMVNSTFKVHDDDVTCDPLRLFQRISVFLGSQDDLQNYFQYELSPYPMALFGNGNMRQTQKSTLYSIFEVKENGTPPQDSYFVIDGGHLLHKVVWPRFGTYGGVDLHGSFIRRKFEPKCSIVFDG